MVRFLAVSPAIVEEKIQRWLAAFEEGKRSEADFDRSKKLIRRAVHKIATNRDKPIAEVYISRILA